MIPFAVPPTWATEQVDAVATYLERLVADISGHVPVDAYLCQSCPREQLHLALDHNAVFIDEYRADSTEDRLDLDWSPAQLAAVTKTIHAILDDLGAQLDELMAHGATASSSPRAQLEFPSWSRPSVHPSDYPAYPAWADDNDIPF